MSEIQTHAGKFIANDSLYKANATKTGVDMTLEFAPGKGVDAKKFGMVQIANSIVGGSPTAINPTVGAHSIPSGEKGAGYHVDHKPDSRTPMYAVENQPAKKNGLADGKAENYFGQDGYHYMNQKTKKLSSKNAKLIDKTDLGAGVGPNSSQKFESTCLATAGKQQGTYFGSVSWGWESDASGTFKKLPLTLVSAGAPSATFERAAELWNAGTTSTGEDTIDLPLPSAQKKAP